MTWMAAGCMPRTGTGFTGQRMREPAGKSCWITPVTSWRSPQAPARWRTVPSAGGSGLRFSGDGGTSWSERSSGLGAGHGALRIDLSDSSVLYLETDAGGLYRSTDEGQRWEVIGDQGRQQSFDLSPGTLYRAGVEGILSSSDLGVTWTTIQVPGGSVFVGTNPRRPGTLYAV